MSYSVRALRLYICSKYITIIIIVYRLHLGYLFLYA